MGGRSVLLLLLLLLLLCKATNRLLFRVPPRKVTWRTPPHLAHSFCLFVCFLLCFRFGLGFFVVDFFFYQMEHAPRSYWSSWTALFDGRSECKSCLLS